MVLRRTRRRDAHLRPRIARSRGPRRAYRLGAPLLLPRNTPLARLRPHQLHRHGRPRHGRAFTRPLHQPAAAARHGAGRARRSGHAVRSRSQGRVCGPSRAHAAPHGPYEGMAARADAPPVPLRHPPHASDERHRHSRNGLDARLRPAGASRTQARHARLRQPRPGYAHGILRLRPRLPQGLPTAIVPEPEYVSYPLPAAGHRTGPQRRGVARHKTHVQRKLEIIFLYLIGLSRFYWLPKN